MSNSLETKVSAAVRHFWRTRNAQKRKQGSDTGKRDAGSRGAVTGGKQLDGFVRLIRNLLTEAGLPENAIHVKSGRTILPGFFRPTKEWDLLVLANGTLLATIEFKSQVGPSFGNNFNNRTEEALGSATDLWTAYREGVFKPSARPWLGYFMLLEESDGSTSPVRTNSPHFEVLPEFVKASYAGRYELFCTRLVRERLYDAACLLMSDRQEGLKGLFREPSEELSISHFAASLVAHAGAFARTTSKRQT